MNGNEKQPLYRLRDRSALEAKEDAQRIAWGPFVFQAAQAMRDLGVLGYLEEKGKEGANSEETALELGLSVYGARVLLEGGLGIGLVHFWEDERFTLAKTGYFVQNDEMTNVNMDFVDDVCYQGIQDLQESILSGRPEGLKVFGNWSNIYQGLSEMPERSKESWLVFDNYYSGQAFEDVRPYFF